MTPKPTHLQRVPGTGRRDSITHQKITYPQLWSTRVRKWGWTYLGHVLWMPTWSLPHEALDGKPPAWEDEKDQGKVSGDPCEGGRSRQRHRADGSGSEDEGVQGRVCVLRTRAGVGRMTLLRCTQEPEIAHSDNTDCAAGSRAFLAAGEGRNGASHR